MTGLQGMMFEFSPALREKGQFYSKPLGKAAYVVCLQPTSLPRGASGLVVKYLLFRMLYLNFFVDLFLSLCTMYSYKHILCVVERPTKTDFPPFHSLGLNNSSALCISYKFYRNNPMH